MAKSLKNLIRLHRWIVDERRRELGVLLTREETILNAQRDLEEEMRREAEAIEQAPDGALSIGAYVAHCLERRARLAQELRQVEAEIEQARDRVGEAFKELKTYEIAQAEREKKERLERERKEQLVLDEIGQDRHRRRQAGAGLM